ncbi:PadR family transcriptional regulator [Gordonibacter sp. An230]|uniref:PadR family transcriptional regulator n=1 Tax=Gordonibacter sp. An230 TaxID=1965592 RepID=UPI000B39A374|nr:PadR family transcriptional regulator [Gordonibacter sp. An230]OUO87030.1 PadR family transcriptional regulator [Gordonibacter sp. An230]
MASRDKHLPLTETAFYTLLALRQPAHGYLVMQKVKELSGGAVSMAAGTMYGALDNLQRQGLICQVGSPDGRRKTYQITPYGSEVLELDVRRIEHMARAARESGGDHA